MTIFKTIDEYIEAQPQRTKAALFILKKAILDAAPHAVEMFNYGIPAFALIEGGKRDQQIMIAGYSKHVGLYPHPTTIEHFDAALSAYKRGKGSVQFPVDQEIPAELVYRMVKYRLGLVK